MTYFNFSEIILKVLAHNNFIGRIIGKGGNIINTIKKDTDTKFVENNLFLFERFSRNSITVSSINELNSQNAERIISIKGELEQQIRALETIYIKLCAAYENDNVRAWNYPTSQYQQQQQIMQHFAQQAAVIAAAGNAGPSLLPTHYPPQQQSIIQQTPTNNSNNSPNKYLEQQPHPSAIYHQPYYVNFD